MAEELSGALVSAFLDVVLDRLVSDEVVGLNRGKKLDNKLLQRLQTTLKVVRNELDDAHKKQIIDFNVNYQLNMLKDGAEEKQITDSNVKNWLNRLKDAVYEADDLLDEVSTKAATQNKVNNLFFRYSYRKVVSKLENIVLKVEAILRSRIFDLKKIVVENTSWRAPSTSLYDRFHIYGRDKDKEAIIKLLLEDSSDDEEVSVIPIVGMAGVGKTTLAQSLYNDEYLKHMFDFKAWVCVSQEFHILEVTKTLTEAITGEVCSINDLNLLYLDLMDKLKDKKFLIVLDDVWIEDDVKWRLLTKLFQRGIRGSRILVTTHNKNVASILQTVPAYHLNELSNEDCWFVFAEHACLSTESSENTTTLEEIGREMVKKCNGLPLAAESLGSMLSGKHDIRDWNTMLKSDIWELSESECDIIPTLRKSYHYLPPPLKRCFVYCSLYPKNYEFQKDELILLWMAEDLLKPQRKDKTSEEIGHEYFDYFVSISFFQHSTSWPWRKCFVMHKLIHDLATSLGSQFYFRAKEFGKETKIGRFTRHLSFTKLGDWDNSEVFKTVKKLRTFLLVNLKDAPLNNENAPCIIMPNLKRSRVLSFCGLESLNVLPDSIGKLIHLRYLNLSYTGVETLPESLCSLYNLQTLKLSNCRKLIMLPSGMQSLVNLRHLSIHSTSIKEMPRGMRKLKQLQHLDYFIVGKHEKNGIKELGGLDLHGPLSIVHLENVTKSHEASEAGIVDKKHINNLSLEWSECDNDGRDFQIEVDVLCKLQPHQDLVFLSIRGYKGTRFPDWVGNFSYYNMTYLSLCNCNNCYILPSLGQLPSLKDLHISSLNSVKIIGASFYKTEHCSFVKPFPSLESLTIHNMPCWEAWISFDLDAFPLLKDLEICHCSNLRGDLPNHLPALESLKIEDCKLFVSSLPRTPALQRLKICGSKKVRLHEFPILVESLELEGSPTVEFIMLAITNIKPTSLQSLTLSDCSSAISFSGGGLPASLKSLNIWGLKNLEFPMQQKHELLESLEIYDSCDSLTFLPLVIFPRLKRLLIVKCENLQSLLVSQSESSKNLSSFEIRDCPNFFSFPTEGLPAPNLIRFTVDNCEKLKSLPDQMSTLLPKLQYLHIYNCPEIESFPEGGMPPNLRLVGITDCEKLLRGVAWPSMDMVTSLYIQGPCYGIKSFPKEGMLPPSLTSLHLFDFSSLETLDCEGLIHLKSLQELDINSCQKLENMAGERLPASLIKFRICESPLLQEQCHTMHRQIWPKISHICDIDVGSMS